MRERDSIHYAMGYAWGGKSCTCVGMRGRGNTKQNTNVLDHALIDALRSHPENFRSNRRYSDPFVGSDQSQLRGTGLAQPKIFDAQRRFFPERKRFSIRCWCSPLPAKQSSAMQIEKGFRANRISALRQHGGTSQWNRRQVPARNSQLDPSLSDELFEIGGVSD